MDDPQLALSPAFVPRPFASGSEWPECEEAEGRVGDAAAEEVREVDAPRNVALGG